MRYIGDVHCRFKEYIEITKGCVNSTQVGDFGLGFGYEAPMLDSGHKFIRGNHDKLSDCKLHPNWIKDSTYDETTSTYFCGGAWSIDGRSRLEGRDKWDDEELSYSDFNIAIDHYASCKPRTVVTHDIPIEIARRLFRLRDDSGSRTQNAFQTMLEIHQPQTWIFGHYHQSVRQVIDGVRFICLAPLEYMDI